MLPTDRVAAVRRVRVARRQVDVEVRQGVHRRRAIAVAEEARVVVDLEAGPGVEVEELPRRPTDRLGAAVRLVADPRADRVDDDVALVVADDLRLSLDL
jgi:hypothetical protein